VYHKLVALRQEGIRVHLHCFRYDREPAGRLNELCDEVFYYPRQTGLASQFSLKPYIVTSRRSKELIGRLLENNYPILFEGLHSCYYLDHPRLKGRLRIYRESNIEHHYYYQLFRSERKLLARTYFLLESFKLRLYQSVLKDADHMLAVSESDCSYLQEKFPDIPVTYLPSFHGNSEVRSLPGTGTYAFYHGNLSVAENVSAAEYLIREVFKGLDYPLVIAGLNPPDNLKKLAADHGVRLVENASPAEMQQMLSEAHINLLVTFQATGLKLKLLNTLYQGRHVLVNPPMLAGTGLDSLCVTGTDTADLREKLTSLIRRPFDAEAIRIRSAVLSERYSDKLNARKLIEITFPGVQYY